MRVRDDEIAAFVEMALGAVHREYPYHLMVLLRSEADVAPPAVLTPAFRGAFDWHSAVHGHWALVRAMRLFPDAAWAPRARAAVGANLTRERLAAEHAFASAPGREGFERPYGLAWVLQLAAELREWRDDDAGRWGAALAPLESLAAERLRDYVTRLPWPVRAGEHSQTAFAMGLALDWARVARDDVTAARLAQRALDFFGADRAAPVVYEPSGHDFLSPALGEADLLRRVMPSDGFARWLEGFLPPPGDPALAAWLAPVRSPDRADGKLAHLDGLQLSRAWMLAGVAAALPPESALAAPLRESADAARRFAVAAARSTHYAGTHWLGSFAVYLLTDRGLA